MCDETHNVVRPKMRTRKTNYGDATKLHLTLHIEIDLVAKRGLCSIDQSSIDQSCQRKKSNNVLYRSFCACIPGSEFRGKINRENRESFSRRCRSSPSTRSFPSTSLPSGTRLDRRTSADAFGTIGSERYFSARSKLINRIRFSFSSSRARF